MIKNTFLHLPGKGKESEHKLWKDNITDWDKYSRRLNDQYTLFGDETTPEILRKSYSALMSSDFDFFAETLPSAEYYRLALSSPEDVVFLDIETTGLSVYYDIITVVGWSVGKKFGIYINGHDETLFRDVVEKAKVLVTFNGIMFDLKFIEKHFKGIKLPPIHVDLRYFARRVGLSGGQKAIEKELGFARNQDLEGMLGEAAPILWHKYRRGDKDALKRLIEYNHADVEGMKAILDECITRIYVKDEIPKKIQSKYKFSKRASQIDWAKRKPGKMSYKIYIPKYSGSTKPLITYAGLDRLYPLDSLVVAGIDLVSSEERETGFCILKGNEATTCRIKTDEDMIQLALDSKVDLVSIDSPLSIPKGRTTFWDDDPYRDEFGITRECERILKKRGISSYPCLIPSMQKLTQRGMQLAEKFRKRGIPVIESYPGAAQDIMSIPRKQAGLEYLVAGLKEFGIRGEFTEVVVSHDELDAITSAIVGLFFWAGKFEALGNADEEYLFIPSLHADHKSWQQRKVVGISGEIAAGKTTLAKELVRRGFVGTRFSRVLENILNERNIEINRSSLQELGWRVNQKKGQRWLGKQAINFVIGEKKIVVDGLRFPEDRALFIELFGPAFMHVHIDCSLEVRESRLQNSVREDVAVKEASVHSVENSIALLATLTSSHISNEGSISSFLKNGIEKILG